MDYTVPLFFVFFGFCIPSSCVRRQFHLINLNLDWAEAQHYCRVHYTDLATIESMDDVHRLQRPTSDTTAAWIGLSDDPKSWKGVMGNDTNSWRWSATGETSKTGYQNWLPGQPDFYLASETCVKAEYDGTWKDDSCNRILYFVCYNDTVPPGQKTYILIYIELSWGDARAYCRTHYTDLAMIEDAQENTEMLSAKSTHVAWIGLYRVPWTWSDNSSVSFAHWENGQPNNGGGSQFCVAEAPVIGNAWFDARCHEKTFFWCQEDPKMKMTVRMKIHTDADLSDPAINAQILQQLDTVLKNKTGRPDLNLEWAMQPREQGEE